MSDDQDGCEWVVFLLVPAYPGSRGPTSVKRLCVCVCVRACVRACAFIYYHYLIVWRQSVGNTIEENSCVFTVSFRCTDCCQQ